MADFVLLAYVCLFVGSIPFSWQNYWRVAWRRQREEEIVKVLCENLFQLLNISNMALGSKQQSVPQIQVEDCSPVSKGNLAVCSILRGGALKEE